MSSNRLQLHPLVLWLCLLGGIIGLAAFSMGLLVLAPNSMGLAEQNYAISSAFAFDAWEINTRHGIVSFPEGGLAVEVYQQDRLTAFVIWGKTNLDLTSVEMDTSELEDIQVTAVFMSEKELLGARGSIFIRSTDSPDAYLQAANFLNSEKRFLPTLQVFGSQRGYPFPTGVARFVFLDSAGQRFTYQEGLQVRLQGPSNKQSFWSERPYKLHPPLLDGTLATMLYICCILLLLTATYFSTLGWRLRTKTRFVSPENKQSKTLIYLGLAISYALGSGLIARLELNAIVKTTYDGVFLAFLVYWLNRRTQALLSRRERSLLLPHVGLGLLLGGLGVFLGQLATPRGLAPLSLGQYVIIIGGGLAIALAQEVLWRGLVLEHLAEQFGSWRGLLFTAGLQGLFTFLVWLMYPVSTLGPLNTLLFVPLQAIWLGYTYLRTDDLLTPCTISVCLAILPQLFLF